MCIIHHDDRIVYINSQRIGERERRTHGLNDLRYLLDAALELKKSAEDMKRITQESWPADLVPPEVISIYDHTDRVVAFADLAIARARRGALRNIGEHSND